MKISTIQMKQFRRFTDTTIKGIPETARLVIIAGPNGCGKSSLFEALNTWKKLHGGHARWDLNYHVKQNAQAYNLDQAVKLTFHGASPQGNVERVRESIYIRSAYRNDPEFELSSISRMGKATEENRLFRLIENDAAVSQNYQRLAGQGLEEVHDSADPAMTIGAYREQSIGEIRAATQRLFPDLVMNSLGNPLVNGTFKFDKGDSKGFLYKNLSGGEKAAFDLILDIIVKRKEYKDTVFCIDEPEAHMNTRLQGQLLKELYNAIGDSSQLWLATHSAGMMRAARDLEREHHGTVVFLDFGNRNFDAVQVIQPEKPNRAFWERVLDVAFDDMAALIAPSNVVLCEGSPVLEGRKHEAIDAACFNIIFAEELPETRFLSVGNSDSVENDKLALLQAIQILVKGASVMRLVDRDDRSAQEVADAQASGLRVLRRRHIESYLFDDEVLKAYCIAVAQPEKVTDVLTIKATALKNSRERGNAADDIKSASGEIYVEIKKALKLVQVGNTAKQFMRDSLAPVLTSDMQVYKDLKSEIFGNTK